MALRVALSRLVFVISLISFAAMAISLEECDYIVSVKTGDVPKAQTGCPVSLKLLDNTGKNFTIPNLREWSLLSPDDPPFQRGQVDVFKGRNTRLDVCALAITHHVTPGNYSGWYLESVNVTTCYSNSPVSFLVHRWLANDVPPDKVSATVNSCLYLNDLGSAFS